MTLGPNGGETTWQYEQAGIRAFSRPTLVRVGVVALLIGLTIGWFNLVPRYERSGDEILRNGGFDQGLEAWSVQGSEDTVSAAEGSAVLENRDSRRSVRLSQAFPLQPEHRILLLEVDVSTEDVVSATDAGLRARVNLLGRSPEGKPLWYRQLAPVQLSGDNPWRLYTGTLVPPKEASEAVVTAALIRATGVMRLRNLSVFPVRELKMFRIGAYTLLAGWATTALFIVPSVFRGFRSTTARVLIAVVALAILAGTMMPDTLKRGILQSMRNGLRAGQSLLPALPPETEKLLFEAIAGLALLAHGLLFFAIALFVRLFRSDDPAGVQFGLLLLFAAVTETLQYFALSRSPGFGDWLWDVGGISLAFGLAWCFGIGRKRHRT